MKYCLFFVFVFSYLSGCIPVRSIFLGSPDKSDLLRFHSNEIKADTNCFIFKKSDSPGLSKLKVNDWSTDIPFFINLNDLATKHKVRSFLVIQNDTLKYEYHNKKLQRDALHSSYSIAKSFISALIGIAIEEGLIKSVNESVTTYIPELKKIKYAKYLQIEHLLNQTSGIKYRFRLDVNLYYGANIIKQLKTIEFDTIPGRTQHYLNINTQLLGIVLNRATNMSIAAYMQEKIWKPLQMCSDAKWSTDKKNKLEKAFCCIGATALDYAKLGRLYLNKGTWEGKNVFSEKWYYETIKRDTTNGSSFNFNYSWHIGLKEYQDFMAIGLYKQHIYINPEKNLIIVLLNDKEKKLLAERVNWWYVFRQIADQV